MKKKGASESKKKKTKEEGMEEEETVIKDEQDQHEKQPDNQKESKNQAVGDETSVLENSIYDMDTKIKSSNGIIKSLKNIKLEEDKLKKEYEEIKRCKADFEKKVKNQHKIFESKISEQLIIVLFMKHIVYKIQYRYAKII